MFSATSLIVLLAASAIIPPSTARLQVFRVNDGRPYGHKGRPSYRSHLVDNDFFRELGEDVIMSMPGDFAMSMPEDYAMSMPEDYAMSMPVDETMSFDFAMSMPTCDDPYTCPSNCGCGGKVADAGAICDCYSIASVTPPASLPDAQGTWYCFQVDLDKTVDGCGGAKAVSHAVLAAGFSESCTFHPGGQSNDGSDEWDFQECDNTAASGLKYDFGQGDGEQLSVKYCFDVSCEAVPAGQGSSLTWVLKSGNDRCEIDVTDGPIPNCGGSAPACSPSCPAEAGIPSGTTTPVEMCDGSSDKIGTPGSSAVDLNLAFEVETSSSGGSDFASQLATEVLEFAADATSLCESFAGTPSRRLEYDSVTGIEIVDGPSISETATCEPTVDPANECHVVDMVLELSGSDQAELVLAQQELAATINGNVASFSGGDIVNVKVYEEAEDSSAAMTDDLEKETDNSGGMEKHTIVIVCVVAVAGVAAAAAIIYRKASQHSTSDLNSEVSSTGPSIVSAIESIS